MYKTVYALTVNKTYLQAKTLNVECVNINEQSQSFYDLTPLTTVIHKKAPAQHLSPR